MELNETIEIQRAQTTLGRVYLHIAQVNEDDGKGCKIISRDKALIKAEKSFVKSMLVCKDLVGKVSSHELLDMKARLWLNLSLTKEYANDIEKALEYMEKAINLCKNGDLHEILHQCYSAKSALCITKLNDQGAALINVNLALEVADRLSNRAAKCCETLLAKANILIKSGDFQSAKQVLTKAYKLKTPIASDRDLIENNLRTIAALCRIEDELIVVYSGDYKKRRELYEKMGDGSCKLGNYEKAVIYYERMLENAKLNNERGRDLCSAFVSLYRTYQDIKEYKKALVCMREEYQIVKDNPNEAIDTLIEMVKIADYCGEDPLQIYENNRNCTTSVTDGDLQREAFGKLVDFAKEKGQSKLLAILEVDVQQCGLTLEDLKARRVEQMSDDEPVVDTPDIGDEICLDDLTDSGSEVDHDEEETKESKRSSVRRRAAVSAKIKRNDKGESELHKACISGNIPYVKRLLAAGHPINVRDNVGWMPLHEAANHGFKEIVALLLENGGTSVINDRAENGGITPLHDACSNGHFDIIELLLDKGANPTIRTDENETPLNCLLAWRKRSNALDPIEENHYEIIRVRLSESLKKVGIPETMPVKARPKLSSLARGSNKENVTKIGNLRRGILDEDDDSSNDSLLNHFGKAAKNTEATEMYKSAISNLKTNFNQLANTSKSTDEDILQKKRSAYLQIDEVDDDWLDMDIPMQEKKKRRFTNEYVSPKKRSLSLAKRDSSKRYSNPDVEEIPVMNEASKSTDAFDVIMSSKPQGRTRRNSAKSRSSGKGSSTGRNQTSLLQAGFSRTTDGVDESSDNDINDSGITSPIKSNRSSTAAPTVSTPANSSGFVTMKVKIEDQLIVVPVRLAEVSNLTMKWLAESATKRYEK